LAAMLLKPHDPLNPHEGRRWMRPVKKAAAKFNAGFDWLATRYGRLTAKVVRMSAIMLVIYAGLLAPTAWRLCATPSGFIPDQDQGVLIGVVQLPPGASLERTSEVLDRAYAVVKETEGVDAVAMLAGLDGASFSVASNSGTMFIRLTDWSERGDDLSAAAL